MRYLIFLISLISLNTFANIDTNKGNIINLHQLLVSDNENNIQLTKLGSDKNSSEFVIFIKDTVPLHYHAKHTETVFILAGTAQMVMGIETITVKAGDYIRIPAGIHHSVKVTSKSPLKVLSIQAPEFLGNDRVLVK